MRTSNDRGIAMGKAVRESVSEVRLVPDAPDAGEQFGLRVIWQSESERIDAAAFLVATRMQEDVRRRVARVVLDLREQSRDKRSSAFPRLAGD